MNGKILKTLFAVIVVNLVAAGAWWFLYRQINLASADAENLRSEIALAETKQSDVRKLEETMLEISDKKTRIERIFVNEKEIVRFIEGLENLALKSAVNFQITSASLPAGDGSSPRFVLSLDAGFGSLFKFLSALEKMEYQLEVETARFSELSDGGWGLQITLRLISYKPS